jgi:hypothetical protein
MKMTVARAVLGVLVGIACIEWVAALWSYRTRIEASDWEHARDVVEELPANEPVLLATSWLGPRARMHIPALRDWPSAAPADLRGLQRFHVIGLGGDRWSDELQSDLEDLGSPTLESTDDLGALSIHHYRASEPGGVLDTLIDAGDALRVKTEAPCKKSAETWRCEEGTVELRYAEIDYRPRRCYAVDVRGGTLVRLSLREATTGEVLRGHVGFDDFNSRLRSDASVEVTVRIDGLVVARWTVTDEQGWWPFAVRTEPGTHEVSVELRPSLSGIWQRGGYTTQLRHVPCVELRTLEEEAS